MEHIAASIETELRICAPFDILLPYPFAYKYR